MSSRSEATRLRIAAAALLSLGSAAGACAGTPDTGAARTPPAAGFAVDTAALMQGRPAVLEPKRTIVAAWRTAHVLRVCADPNNLPFSNARGEGFENRLAEMIGRDIGARVEYTWWPQRRGFARNTLRAGACDLIMGVPAAYEMAQTTRPYYRSTYVFVTRARRRLDIRSLDDPALRRLRIGIHVIGDDYANTPAAQALAKRGIVRNVVGYSIYGDYSRPDPPANLVRAVERGDVDVAVVWGPLAGYFAKRSPVPLALAAVSPRVDASFLMFAYDIAAGVRRGDTATRSMVEAEFASRRADIRALLREYGVPLLDAGGSAVAADLPSSTRPRTEDSR
jgi:mxaJ protein